MSTTSVALAAGILTSRARGRIQGYAAFYIKDDGRVPHKLNDACWPGKVHVDFPPWAMYVERSVDPVIYGSVSASECSFWEWIVDKM